jgi:multiple antibiotic resistance protein
MIDFIGAVIHCFVTLFIIINPFVSLSAFLPLVSGMPFSYVRKQALIAVSVAFGLLVLFLVLGTKILLAFGVSLSSFKIAGGFVLLLLGISHVLSIEFGSQHTTKKAAAVIIGTPLLCGPGAITTTITLSGTYDFLPVFIGAVGVTVLSFIILLSAEKISHIFGTKLIEVVTKIFGLLLAAIAVEYIASGVSDIIRNFV